MTAVQSSDTLAALFAPSAVTLVGATPRSHVTEVLLANFTRADQPFPGPIHLINPGRTEVFGHPAVPDVEAVDGPLGLVYVLLEPARALAFLDTACRTGAADRASGFVVYGSGFAEAGDVSAQARLTEIAADLGVPLLGPQSTGLVSASAGLVGITDPVPESFVPGRVGLVAQSTGLLGGMLSWLFRRGVGIEKAVGFGNGAALDYTQLAATLCAEPDIDVVCVYVDAVTATDQIVALGEASWRTGTPVVLYPGGWSPAAQAAARSHTGVLATNERAIRGCAEQCGVILVDQFEGLLWATELLGRKDVQALDAAGVGIFTASGGGGIIAVEAIERAGARLAVPCAATRNALGIGPTGAANPFDIGAISLDRPEDYREKVRTYAADDDIAVVVKPESLGAPSQRLASHRRSLESFVEGVTGVGKIPVITYPYPEDPREYADTVRWDEVVVAGGTAELGGKLALLQSYAARPRRRVWPTWYRRASAAAPEAQAATLWSAQETNELLERLGLAAPRQYVVADPVEVDAAMDALAPASGFVAKTAAQLSHRAKLGGVLLGLHSREELAAAVALLAARFKAPVVIAEEVPHEASFFAGLQARPDGRIVLAFGAGVATDDSDVALRLCPLQPTDARRLVANAGVESAAEQVADTLVQVSRTPELAPALTVLDINPFVLAADHRLVALDVKAYSSSEER